MPRSHPDDEKIYIYYKWCKACEICIHICPEKVFELGADGKPIVAHPEKCTLCGLCESHCPDFSIGWTHPNSRSIVAQQQKADEKAAKEAEEDEEAGEDMEPAKEGS